MQIHSLDGNSSRTYLVQVDDRLPEVVALLVEIPHSDLSKVTRMVLVHVRSVVMLSTCKTSSTGMLAVLSYTTMTGRDVSATISKSHQHFPPIIQCQIPNPIAILPSATREIIFSKMTVGDNDLALARRPIPFYLAG